MILILQYSEIRSKMHNYDNITKIYKNIKQLRQISKSGVKPLS
jgi:hypothetical protein